MPGLQALDAVQTARSKSAYTGTLFYVGKDPTFASARRLPSCLNPRQQHGWFYHAGGNELFNAFLAKYNVIGLPCGNTGMQWGGWFRKEIKTRRGPQGAEDAHRRARRHVIARVGVVPQQIAPRRHLSGAGARHHRRGRVHRPLRRREARLPQGREVLLHARLAGGRHAVPRDANTAKWNELPPLYKKAVEVAAQAATTDMLAHYDTKNPEALLRLVGVGRDRVAVSAGGDRRDLAAAQEHYARLIASNANSPRSINSQKGIPAQEQVYHRVADFQ